MCQLSKNTKDNSVKVNSIKYHSYSIFGQMVENLEWLEKIHVWHYAQITKPS